MTDPHGPFGVQELVDQLEADIVDVDAAQETNEPADDGARDEREPADDGTAAGPQSEDTTKHVPGAPEPPD